MFLEHSNRTQGLICLGDHSGEVRRVDAPIHPARWLRQVNEGVEIWTRPDRHLTGRAA